MRYNRLSSGRLAALLVALVVALLIAQPLTVAAMPSTAPDTGRVCWMGTQCIRKGLCSKIKMCTFKMTTRDCRGEAVKTCHYEK
jgi:hypothetical protein